MTAVVTKIWSQLRETNLRKLNFHLAEIISMIIWHFPIHRLNHFSSQITAFINVRVKLSASINHSICLFIWCLLNAIIISSFGELVLLYLGLSCSFVHCGMIATCPPQIFTKRVKFTPICIRNVDEIHIQ